MRNKSVAVLDIRSSEVCAAVGERGVNNTFIIKSKYACPYDGFADGELIDVSAFEGAVRDVVKSTLASTGDRITRFFVGIPGEFIRTVVTDDVITFAAPQRIKASHMTNVRSMSRPADADGYSVVDSSPVYYVLSDKRRVIDPAGCVSDSLRGRISWFLCRDAFAECITRAFKPFRDITRLRFIPTALAEACYLFEPQIRDNYCVFLDMDYISSTYSVACGNGIVFSQSFSVGTGHIAALLMSELDIPFDVASQFLTMVNLNAKERLTSVQEVRRGDKLYSFSTSVLRDLIREGLDGLCEMVVECNRTFAEKDLSGKPLYLTGEGVKTIRGTAEHISGRLECAVHVVSPGVPYYDKPKFSSLFSLLDAALGENSHKIF